MRTKLIFKQSVSDQLEAEGNVLLHVMPNKNYEGLLVYVYPETQKLLRDLTNITDLINKNKK